LEVTRRHLLVLEAALESALLALEAPLLSLEAALAPELSLSLLVGVCAGGGVGRGVGGVGGLLSWEAGLAALGKLLGDAGAVTHHSKHSRASLQEHKKEVLRVFLTANLYFKVVEENDSLFEFLPMVDKWFEWDSNLHTSIYESNAELIHTI
jgi:hypothetical protein